MKAVAWMSARVRARASVYVYVCVFVCECIYDTGALFAKGQRKGIQGQQGQGILCVRVRARVFVCRGI